MELRLKEREADLLISACERAIESLENDIAAYAVHNVELAIIGCREAQADLVDIRAKLRAIRGPL